MGEAEAAIEKELEKVDSVLMKLSRIVHPRWNEKTKLENKMDICYIFHCTSRV